MGVHACVCAHVFVFVCSYVTVLSQKADTVHFPPTSLFCHGQLSLPMYVPPTSLFRHR